ncbi:CocE/NonD family hydrolase [Cytophagaceae bacterium YF14B1]|uniref:CocE/NonD family hydrolase n=1 Tax=Xanthocytophaga flava TaxID=3048013 RepID=A0AAE3QSZ0_9BACT|nr:CocE/NonD family hydrolase [Xanthocytophaga flavus]MDJ1484872.1 CocE/NonD family hydrolase [Xanthocytophaga flavus]
MKTLHIYLQLVQVLCISLLTVSSGITQSFVCPNISLSDTLTTGKIMADFSRNVLLHYTSQQATNPSDYLNTAFRLQMLAGEYKQALQSLKACRQLATTRWTIGTLYLQYEVYTYSQMQQSQTKQSFTDAFTQTFRQYVEAMDNQTLLLNESAFLNDIQPFERDWQQELTQLKGRDSLSLTESVRLCKSYFLYEVHRQIIPLARKLLKEQDDKRYDIQDDVLIPTKDGARLWAIVARPKNSTEPKPTALAYTIYADMRNITQAKNAAAHGYIGVVAHTRGKGLSTDAIVPYEMESKDVNEVIDWITRQPWSNKEVGMYGGSYNGFAQWAAAKHLHPALKTIVPYAAAIPGQGLPMENNVFINANYGWAFHVTNNKYMDNTIYTTPQRWRKMMNSWYESGKPYNKIDSIEGQPNPWLQKWLLHPAFDAYWQNMVPYQKDFSGITIPVLSITGYYDDGQISALHYLKEHYKYNPHAEHYLLIGPYDHVGSQRQGAAVLRGYAIDSVAYINTPELTFQWMDYIFYHKPKPAILKDKINYEVMGANEWRHAPSIKKIHNTLQSFYLSTEKAGDYYRLTTQKPAKIEFLTQTIDMADRSTSHNDYYPDPIIRKELDASDGLAFISEPFTEPVSVDGTFSGNLKISINKKDVDVGIVLYEVLPSGEFFHLSYYLGRASYARDMSKRQLLKPGKIESVPFERTRMVSRQLRKESRLLVILNVNKNPFAQINYGTGKDVSQEDIRDAKEPLQIRWYTDSMIQIPMRK